MGTVHSLCTSRRLPIALFLTNINFLSLYAMLMRLTNNDVIMSNREKALSDIDTSLAHEIIVINEM
jgi:hypothetical protein